MDTEVRTEQAETGPDDRCPMDEEGQVVMVGKQLAPAPDRTVFWKDLKRFLGYCPLDTGEDNTLLLPEIYDAIAVEIGGFYNFVVEEQTSRARLEKLVPMAKPERGDSSL